MKNKGLLLCAGGMSTTIIMNQLNSVNDMDIIFEAQGVTGTNWKNNVVNYDIILVSPQIRFNYQEIKTECDKQNIKCLAIDPLLYNPTKANELWEQIKEELNN